MGAGWEYRTCPSRARQAGTAPATVSGESDRHEATEPLPSRFGKATIPALDPRVRKPAVLAPPSTETAQRWLRVPGGVPRDLSGLVAGHPADRSAGRIHPVPR